MARRLAFRRAPETYDDRFVETMASEYLERTPWTELRLGAVRDLVEPRAGERVLDLGCAAGAMTHFLSGFGCDVLGVDFEEKAVARASELFPGLRFEQADVTDLPYDDASFDKAVAADLVEHLRDEDYAAMLRESLRVLVPGGTLSLYTPNRRHVIERLKAHDIVLAQNPTHVAVRDARRLVEPLARAGFVVERNEWRPSFFRGLRTAERLLGGRVESLRYRLCVRGRKPGTRT